MQGNFLWASLVITLFAILVACNPPGAAVGFDCQAEADCERGMVCVDRGEGDVCAIPCDSDKDCPLGDCKLIQTTRWLFCADDGFCENNSMCE